MLRAVTVLPDPDSPTNATVLPFGISKEIDLTTLDLIFWDWKPTDKFFIETRFSIILNECFDYEFDILENSAYWGTKTGDTNDFSPAGIK